MEYPQLLIKLSIVMTAIKNTRMPKLNLKSSFWLEGEPGNQPNSQNENQSL